MQPGVLKLDGFNNFKILGMNGFFQFEPTVVGASADMSYWAQKSEGILCR